MRGEWNTIYFKFYSVLVASREHFFEFWKNIFKWFVCLILYGLFLSDDCIFSYFPKILHKTNSYGAGVSEI